ncbi:hemolysin D [Pelistega indica]|uniref:Hemolysin D n=1 Tax=Pelistega indica TaxID=1414851 RepID=V8G193_9BURK|nr:MULTISPECIES: efflux RND transporter periplasmic adaptor subunit [Pelistega]ETD70205.1 hemolysin D [Pelistega indica]
MKKIILLLIAVAIAGIAYWQNKKLQTTSYEGIAQVNGRLNLNRIDISSLYPGRIEEILVNEGDNVQKDQVLAKLSGSQINTQVALANAQKQQAQESLQRVKAEQDAAQQQLNLAKIELNNAQKLFKDNLISRTELTRQQTNYAAMVAKVNATKAAQQEVEATISQADAQIDRVKDMQKDYAIKSPISGRIEYKIAELGNVIPAGGKVMSILDTHDVYLNVFLPSYQSNPIKIGDEARIFIEGIDGLFPATIDFIASQAQFTPKSVETQEERAKLMFKVKLKIPEDIIAQYPGLFKGGMTAIGYVKYEANAQWPESLAIKLPNK